MKVYIGPYLDWWGPYQIAELAKHIGFSEDRCREFGDYLSKTKLNDICEWIHSKRNVTRIVKIDNYDVWGLDSTLAYIIHPALLKLKEVKHGSSLVDNEDLPIEMHHPNPSLLAECDNPGDWEAWHKRWSWVLDEIIWAFGEEVKKDAEDHFDIPSITVNMKAYEEYQKRKANGFRLFGKYYQCLWD